MSVRIGRINQREVVKLADADEVQARTLLGADRVRQEAERLAPVLTGLLRLSLTVEEVDGEVRVGWDTGIADYGPIVEFGSEDTAPQPHLRPAAIKLSRR